MTQEKKPHVHAELIKAWADGAEIQDWKGSFWQDCQYPTWNVFHLYRIKPEPIKTERYRRCIWKVRLPLKENCNVVRVISEGEYCPFTLNSLQSAPAFVRWIDEDWQEGVVVDA